MINGKPVVILTENEFSKIEGITLKEKLLDYNNQEVKSVSPFGSSNPVRCNSQATNQGNIANVLQNIIFAK